MRAAQVRPAEPDERWEEGFDFWEAARADPAKAMGVALWRGRKGWDVEGEEAVAACCAWTAAVLSHPGAERRGQEIAAAAGSPTGGTTVLLLSSLLPVLRDPEATLRYAGKNLPWSSLLSSLTATLPGRACVWPVLAAWLRTGSPRAAGWALSPGAPVPPDEAARVFSEKEVFPGFVRAAAAAPRAVQVFRGRAWLKLRLSVASFSGGGSGDLSALRAVAEQASASPQDSDLSVAALAMLPSCSDDDSSLLCRILSHPCAAVLSTYLSTVAHLRNPQQLREAGLFLLSVSGTTPTLHQALDWTAPELVFREGGRELFSSVLPLRDHVDLLATVPLGEIDLVVHREAPDVLCKAVDRSVPAAPDPLTAARKVFRWMDGCHPLPSPYLPLYEAVALKLKPDLPVPPDALRDRILSSPSLSPALLLLSCVSLEALFSPTPSKSALYSVLFSCCRKLKAAAASGSRLQKALTRAFPHVYLDDGDAADDPADPDRDLALGGAALEGFDPGDPGACRGLMRCAAASAGHLAVVFGASSPHKAQLLVMQRVLLLRRLFTVLDRDGFVPNPAVPRLVQFLANDDPAIVADLMRLTFPVRCVRYFGPSLLLWNVASAFLQVTDGGVFQWAPQQQVHLAPAQRRFAFSVVAAGVELKLPGFGRQAVGTLRYCVAGWLREAQSSEPAATAAAEVLEDHHSILALAEVEEGEEGGEAEEERVSLVRAVDKALIVPPTSYATRRLARVLAVVKGAALT